MTITIVSGVLEADVNIILEYGISEMSDEDTRFFADWGYRRPYAVITPATRRKKKSQELQVLEDEVR